MQVCSNLNQCFCNVGFTGSSCSDATTGPGGSPSTGSPGTVFLLSSHSATTGPGGSPSTGSPGTVFLLSSHSIQVNQKSFNKKTLKV